MKKRKFSGELNCSNPKKHITKLVKFNNSTSLYNLNTLKQELKEEMRVELLEDIKKELKEEIKHEIDQSDHIKKFSYYS